MLRICLCCVDGSYQKLSDFATIIFQCFILFFGDYICFEKQFEPIFSFVTLFQGNLHFRDKVGSAACVICFVDVCAYTCPTAEQLIYNSRLSFYAVAEIDYCNGKVHRQIDDDVVCHSFYLSLGEVAKLQLRLKWQRVALK